MSGETGLSSDVGSGARERAAHVVFFLCAALSIVTTVGIVLVLLQGALSFFSTSGISLSEFYLSAEWHPQLGDPAFGVWPLVSGTLAVTIGSAVIALPTGVLTAIYLSEYADERSRAWLKPALEVLAGVPTVVYGVFALIYITPFLAGIVHYLDSDLPVFSSAVSLPPLRQFNALSASIVVGIMIIPMVASISEDAMEAVPDSLREAAYGLGATKFEVATTVVVPSATSGIVSSFILALSRAIGETMAVTIAAGMSARLVNPLNPLDYFNSIMPMTAAMVKLKTGEATTQSAAYKSLFAIGLTLFVITFAMNVVSELISGRFREVYE